MSQVELDELKRIHFVGVGGIGMSSIAQLLNDSGFVVSGSDRAVEAPESALIFDALRKRGILLYPQDGSFCNESMPDLIVYSTAIEDDNPDFCAAPEIPRIHRAEMLNLAIKLAGNRKTVAVSGSCGKTSVTAWLAEALLNAGVDPVMIGGGLSNRFIASDLAGNYRPGVGDFFVFEADESDKSLLNYSPDYALLLNIGTDHYKEGELVVMFRQFVSQVKHGIVVSLQVYELLGAESFEHLNTVIFTDVESRSGSSVYSAVNWAMDSYAPGKASFLKFSNGDNGGGSSVKLPMPGRHSGLNALAVLCMMELLGFDINESVGYVEDFKGVWRRSDFAGVNVNGSKVYDDYAHNVEKIISCINTAHEESESVIAVFQPHGFKPLEFMREPLFDALESHLSDNDIFCMLPVYYAGGSTSFSPTSEEVIASYLSDGNRKYAYFCDRDELKETLDRCTTGDETILVMGARDNSLSCLAKALSE